MFVERVNKLKVAPGFEPGAQIGPLINSEILEKVDALVQGAVKDGARVAAGGRRLGDWGFRAGAYYAPAVPSKGPEEGAVGQEDSFCPCAPLPTFKGAAQI